MNNNYSVLTAVCSECDSSKCFCLSDSLNIYAESDIIVKHDKTDFQNKSFVQNDLSVISESSDFNTTSESLILLSDHVKVHACTFQRPSTVNDHVGMHVLNASNDYHMYQTSLHNNMAFQHSHSNQSYESLLSLQTMTNEIQLLSTQESQQVFDSQDTLPDTVLSSNNTNHNESLSVEVSQHDSISSHQSLSSNVFNIGFKDKGFCIGHLNVQGLSNKVDQLKLLLQSEKNLIHVFGISETKLNEVHPDTSFEISGYQKPFRRDRKENSGGGLLVYVKEGVCCSRRVDLEHERLECIWVEVKPINSKPFFVGHIYRPPNSTIQWNEFFEDCIEKVLQEEKELYILGDINRDLLKEQIQIAWNDYIEPFGLTQFISEPTRVTSESRTLLDHIYSNCPENVKSVLVPKIGLSDHFPIFLTRKMHNYTPKGNHYTISYRSFKNFDEAKFIGDLQAAPWNLIELFDDTDDILEAWVDLFLQVVDKHIPIKIHRVKHKTQPDWLSPDILDAMKTRDRHKSLGNENDYKLWRNKVTKLINQAKKDQYQTYIENNKNKPGSIYKLFQEVGAGKVCKKASNISSINDNGTHIEDPTELANSFNNFFVNIAAKLKEPIASSNHDKLKDFCKSKLPENTKFIINNIEKDKVLYQLTTLDSSKATGIDGIGPRLLKLAAPYIADDIAYICNQSINKSTFPNKWKEAKVSPLHKSGTHDDINNYRPISILPVLSKILEKHVHDCLSAYLHEHSLLHKTQSGFRAQHSCETALVHMIDSWLTAMDSGKMVGAVLVDFKKAFDLVDHKILLSKLELYGINNEALMWFDSYLTHRRQLVSLNNSKSDFETVICGVPQGSILGPLLFLLFINDLPLCVENVSADLYADDTTLYDIHTSLEAIEQNLQQSLNKLYIWCRNNGMVLNSAKTKVMLIATRQKRQKLNTSHLDLQYMDETLKMISSDKILGIFVDDSLTWSHHVKHVCKKISSYIWLLSKIKHFLSQAHRVQFYKSYIQPHIDFCNIVWGNSSESNKMKIFRLQKRACRIILNYHVEDSHAALSSLKILSVYDRLFLRKAKFMFKVYHELTPKYISENFTRRNEMDMSVHLRSTATGCFVPPLPKKECFKRSMRYSGCLIWNSLPSQVKSAQTAETFHNRCIKWLTL